jgi:anaerobic ribonucleoside-triphosphate reductase activating protein
MNYLKIDKFDTANGEGVGAVLWVSGCDIKCPECHNQDSWDPKAGAKWDKETEKELFNILNNPYLNRLTITGGHPLMKCNRETVYRLIKKVKANFPHIKIWLYTGYTIDQCKVNVLQKIIKLCDVIVDGPFIKELYQPNLLFRGSTNQRILTKEDLF